MSSCVAGVFSVPCFGRRSGLMVLICKDHIVVLRTFAFDGLHLFLLSVTAGVHNSSVAVVWRLLRVVAIDVFQQWSRCILDNSNIARPAVERSQCIADLFSKAASYEYVLSMFFNLMMRVFVHCLMFFWFHAGVGAAVFIILCFQRMAFVVV